MPDYFLIFLGVLLMIVHKETTRRPISSLWYLNGVMLLIAIL